MSQFASLVGVGIAAIAGAINPTDDGAQYDDPADNKVYTDYIVQNHYYYDPGVVGMAVASPGGFSGDSTAFITLHAPTLFWVSDWTCCMLGGQPEIPSKKPADKNWVLIFAAPVTRNIAKAADGASSLYRISGTYVYQHSKPDPDVYANARFGLPPFLDENPSSPQTVTGLEQAGIADAP